MGSLTEEEVISNIGEETYLQCMLAAQKYMTNNNEGSVSTLPDIITTTLVKLFDKYSVEQIADFMVTKIESLGWYANRDVILKGLLELKLCSINA